MLLFLKCNSSLTIYLLIFMYINTLELTQSDEIRSNKDPQFLSLPFPFLFVPRVPLVLHTHPEFVHLGEVELYEVNGVHNGATFVVTTTPVSEPHHEKDRLLH